MSRYKRVSEIYKRIEDFVFRKEAWFFGFFMVLSLLHFWLTRYVPSLDGPQHICNANVIDQLVKGNPLFEKFYSINPVLVGYWSGHFFLSLFDFFPISRSTVSTDWESVDSGLATPPTATFWMCGVFEPRIDTILLA